jgi:hypothetical protein
MKLSTILTYIIVINIGMRLYYQPGFHWYKWVGFVLGPLLLGLSYPQESK